MDEKKKGFHLLPSSADLRLAIRQTEALVSPVVSSLLDHTLCSQTQHTSALHCMTLNVFPFF